MSPPQDVDRLHGARAEVRVFDGDARAGLPVSRTRLRASVHFSAGSAGGLSFLRVRLHDRDGGVFELKLRNGTNLHRASP